MITLFQYCDHCNTERNFNPDTLKCNTCNKNNRSNEIKNSNTRKPTQHKSK